MLNHLIFKHIMLILFKVGQMGQQVIFLSSRANPTAPPLVETLKSTDFLVVFFFLRDPFAL